MTPGYKRSNCTWRATPAYCRLTKRRFRRSWCVPPAFGGDWPPHATAHAACKHPRLTLAVRMCPENPASQRDVGQAPASACCTGAGAKHRQGARLWSRRQCGCCYESQVHDALCGTVRRNSLLRVPSPLRTLGVLLRSSWAHPLRMLYSWLVCKQGVKLLQEWLNETSARVTIAAVDIEPHVALLHAFTGGTLLVRPTERAAQVLRSADLSVGAGDVYAPVSSVVHCRAVSPLHNAHACGLARE